MCPAYATREVPERGRGAKQLALIEVGGFCPKFYGTDITIAT